MKRKQSNFPWPERDFSYINFIRKAYEIIKDPSEKSFYFGYFQYCEAERDFFAGSIRQINNLIQLDPTPNLDLKEARCEIYKISVSFAPICKFLFKQ